MSIKTGYTLIELMVVISIIALLAGLGVAAYSNFNQTQTLKAAANDLKNNLRLAQNKALSQEKPSACSCYTGYQATIGATSYTIQAFCKTEIEDYACGPVETFTAPNGVSLAATLPAGESSIRFWIMKGGATPATITVSGFGKTPITVTVTKTGEIY